MTAGRRVHFGSDNGLLRGGNQDHADVSVSTPRRGSHGVQCKQKCVLSCPKSRTVHRTLWSSDDVDADDDDDGGGGGGCWWRWLYYDVDGGRAADDDRHLIISIIPIITTTHISITITNTCIHIDISMMVMVKMIYLPYKYLTMEYDENVD